jgi:glycerophosphoryl diester phosphodiesterase
VAHRGLLRHAPENTLANVRACVALRLGFEFDVRRSRDGRLVCLHDATVDRTTDGTGAVAELTFTELRELDAGRWFDARFAGQRVPVPAEVFEVVSRASTPGLLIRADLKVPDSAVEILALAKREGLVDRVLLPARDDANAARWRRLRKHDPHAQIMAVANEPQAFDQAITAGPANWIELRFLPSPQQVTRARQAGKRIFTADPAVRGNQPEQWRRLAERSVDALLTDVPLEFRIARQKDRLED